MNYSKLFEDLSSDKFTELWPAQDYVLTKYFESYTQENDLAIELPTGAGKTLIALIIAETWRRNKKKVAILSANKTLARQFAREAQLLNIPIVLMEGRGADIPARDKRDYQRKNKIAVMNYWFYFNQNPAVDPADLLIMDDAHLAEHCLHTLWSFEIDRFANNDLFNKVVTELHSKFPEYTVLQDAIEEDPFGNTPPELLSFIDQINISSRLREMIDSSDDITSNTDLKFRWDRIRNSLREANIYLDVNSIWIRPYIYPLTSLSHYSKPNQKLYMSATIGDPSDLCRRLGIRKIVKLPIEEEYTKNTSGRRLIAMNCIEDKDIPVRLEEVILKALDVVPKSVWLCNSKNIAVKFKDLVNEWLKANGVTHRESWLLTNMGDEIEKFKKAKSGHLFIGGRFDGMDFTGEECRLVILTTLPKAINIQEEFMCAHLRDASFMKRRLNHRIIQALGRCNRSNSDYASYVLADKRFATHFSSESNRVSIPRNIIAEIDMAEDMANIDIKELLEVVGKFMSADFSSFDENREDLYNQISQQESAESENDIDTDLASNEVLGWTAMFYSKNYKVAAESFEKCWQKSLAMNSRELCAFYGWCWAKSIYLQSLESKPGAKELSLDILEKSIDRGGISSWFNRMRSSLNRARSRTDSGELLDLEYRSILFQRFNDLLEQYGVKGNRFEKRCNLIETKLNSNNHDEFQEGLYEVGFLLGFHPKRPKYNASTDCLWKGIFGNHKEIITFEIKIEDAESSSITASDIGQVHNQINRSKSEYETSGFTIRGCIVSHLDKFEPEVEPSAGAIRIITKDAVLTLWKLLKDLLVKYRNLWSLHDYTARSNAENSISNQLPKSGWLIRVLDNEERFIGQEALLSEWKI